MEISRGGAEQRLKVVLGQRRLTGPDPCQRLFSEANAHLASAAESRKLAEAALLVVAQVSLALVAVPTSSALR